MSGKSHSRESTARDASTVSSPRQAEGFGGGSLPAAPNAAPAVIAAIVAFGAYLTLSASSPADGDSGELTIVLAKGALAHPTGYPLYTLLGHPFCLLMHAMGATWSFAANAWSALGGAFAVYFFYRLAECVQGAHSRRNRAASVLIPSGTTTLFALNPMITAQTTQAEVYAWHLAWVAGVLYLFHRLVAAFGSGRELEPRRILRMAATWGFACGVGGTHHRSAIFIAIPASLAILRLLFTAPAPRLKASLVCIGAALSPFLSYAFVFWKTTHPDEADWRLFTPSMSGAIDHIRGSMYSWIYGDFAPSELQRMFIDNWISPWMYPGLSLLAVLAAVGRSLSSTTVVLLVAGCANLVFARSLCVSDPAPYFLPSLSVSLLAIPGCWGGLFRFLTPNNARRCAILIAVVALIFGGIWFAKGLERKSVIVSIDTVVRTMWKSLPDEPGIVFWDSDMHQQLRMLQYLENDRRALDVWNATALDSDVGRSKFRAAHGFDPLDGLDPALKSRLAVRLDDYRAWIRRNVNRQTALPVFEFDPSVPAVRRLNKAARPESRR